MAREDDGGLIVVAPDDGEGTGKTWTRSRTVRRFGKLGLLLLALVSVALTVVAIVEVVKLQNQDGPPPPELPPRHDAGDDDADDEPDEHGGGNGTIILNPTNSSDLGGGSCAGPIRKRLPRCRPAHSGNGQSKMTNLVILVSVGAVISATLILALALCHYRRTKFVQLSSARLSSARSARSPSGKLNRGSSALQEAGEAALQRAAADIAATGAGRESVGTAFAIAGGRCGQRAGVAEIGWRMVWHDAPSKNGPVDYSKYKRVRLLGRGTHGQAWLLESRRRSVVTAPNRRSGRHPQAPEA